jgi:hypothetical protein
LTGDGGFLPEMIKAVLERGAAEQTAHLGYERGDPAGRGTPNSRNGSTPKTLATEVGDAPVLEEVKVWQARPLEEIYPIVYLDALMIKVRDGHQVRNGAAHRNQPGRRGRPRRDQARPGDLGPGLGGGEVLGRSLCRAAQPRRPRRDHRLLRRTDRVPRGHRGDAAGAVDEELGVFLWLAVTTGVRRGELVALRWSDFELERGLLRVHRGRLTHTLGVRFATRPDGRSREVVGVAPEALISSRRRDVTAKAAELIEHSSSASAAPRPAWSATGSPGGRRSRPGGRSPMMARPALSSSTASTQHSGQRSSTDSQVSPAPRWMRGVSARRRNRGRRRQ